MNKHITEIGDEFDKRFADKDALYFLGAKLAMVTKDFIMRTLEQRDQQTIELIEGELAEPDPDLEGADLDDVREYNLPLESLLKTLSNNKEEEHE